MANYSTDLDTGDTVYFEKDRIIYRAVVDEIKVVDRRHSESVLQIVKLNDGSQIHVNELFTDVQQIANKIRRDALDNIIDL